MQIRLQMKVLCLSIEFVIEYCKEPLMKCDLFTSKANKKIPATGVYVPDNFLTRGTPLDAPERRASRGAR